ncbi:RNA-binding S4 domain-containing protein [Calderihabitans maritimus]|uniref:RQC P-site tRNA stabilizing factor n=1 Tax=Calderihabitans maritimus TaxID=1246530 RepID=A0A1Z5HQ64_9FIRM|nr:RNA-binding S4 domain-containing protein [Calderihabitans maritimus]GAW91669.1 RNA-binding S4 [Calderihabitans maritimus]
MRLDKFLKCSRLIKRRTLAKEFCAAGRVQLNGKVAKPGAAVKEGDILLIDYGTRKLKVEVLSTSPLDKKDSAGQAYRIID